MKENQDEAEKLKWNLKAPEHYKLTWISLRSKSKNLMRLKYKSNNSLSLKSKSET